MIWKTTSPKFENAKRSFRGLSSISLPFSKTLIVLLIFSGCFFNFSTTYSQVFVPDGDYTASEYAAGQVKDIKLGSNNTCDVQQVYAVVKSDTNGPYLLLGLFNGNNGSSIFRYYLDTDPSLDLVSETYKSKVYPFPGADVVLQIDANDSSTLFYKWNGTNLVLNNASGLIAEVGDFAPNDGKFIEIKVPLSGSGSVIDLCDLAEGGVINLGSYLSFKGGNLNSAPCGGESIDLDINVSGTISGEATYCSGSPNSTTLTLTGNFGAVEKWQKDEGAGWVDIANTTTTYVASNVNVTTSYRAIILNSNCPDKTVETGSATITINTLDNATFIYSASSYCSDDNDPTPTVTGVIGGSFSSNSGLIINSSTGVIDLDASTSGSYTITYSTENAGTCTNTSTINLTINNSTSSEETQTACDSYSWNGTEYTESGVYTFESVNEAGCTNTNTLNLTINNSTTSEETQTACDSYSWNGTAYTESGVYTFESENEAGCTNTATLNLTINNSTTSEETQTACDSYSWNGTAYTESGVYTFESENEAGCTNTATLNLTINNSTTSEETQTACDSYSWNGTEYTESGVYTFESENEAGCINTATLNLTINNSTTSEERVTACDSFTWNGETYTESGTYTFESENEAGCTNVATLNLTITKSTTSTQTETACDSFTWNGETYTESGTYTFESENEAGCTNVATLNLTITKSTTSTQTETACDSFTWNGETYTESGTYTFESENEAGCTNVATLNLTITKSTTSTQTETACDSYSWNGETYTESGTYTFESENEAGCTNVATLNLTITKSTTSTQTETACDSFTWNGETYTESGTYTFESENEAGCTNVATLNLTITKSTTSTQTETACDSYSWNGETYTESGTYTFESENEAGCTNVATLNLTITKSTTSTQTETACDSFTWNGETYTESGTYTFESENEAGCTNVATLNLTITKSTTSTQTETACDSFTWNGETYTESGTYTFESENEAGCTNVATLNLTITKSTTSTQTETACDSFTWNGETYTESGTYTFESENEAGCTNVATLNLTITKSTTSTQTETACDSFTWNGETYTESGTYTFESENEAGCTNVATLNLTITKSTTSTQTETACDSFTWNGETYTESGTYTFESENEAGCTNVATLNLTITKSTTSTQTETACDSYSWNGETYTESGTYTFESENEAGCTNVATLNLTITKSTTSTQTETACDSYSWNGETYTESGTYTFESENEAGCTNVATLNLTITKSTTSTQTETACDSFTWNGETYTESGTYTFESENEAGCTNVATLNLTITKSTTSTQTETACDSFTWNGETYTESGTYTFESENEAGCTNVATLNLTITKSTTSTQTETACDSFTWNGETYTESGTYTFESENEAGCTNVATLNLTINPTPGVPVIASKTNTTCSLNNGSISLVITEGVEYSIDGDNYQTNGDLNNLTPNIYSITARFIDGECISSSTEVEIIAIPDTDDPELSEMEDIVIDTDPNVCGAVVSFSDPTATDNCDGTEVTLNEGSLASGSVFPVGTTSVTYTATDAAGNTSTVSFEVIVTDNQDPTISCPIAVTQTTEIGESFGIVNFENAKALDNCDVTVEQTSGLVSGSEFPIGVSTVEFTATDASGNTTTCNFTITITDEEPTTIVCPSNIDMDVDQGVCGAVVSFETPVATDNSDLEVTVTQTAGPTSGEVFPVGTTTVTFTATDAAGNQASCSFDVTVNDTEDPTFGTVSDMEVDTDADACGAVVTFSAPTATDNCDGTEVTLNEGSLASGSEFPVGTTSVTHTATDAAGNTSTVSFDVIVTDNQDPTIACPGNIITTNVVGQDFAVVTYTEITATDNCGVTVERTTGLASGEQFPIGTTVVTYVATDASGNTTECSFTVLVKGTPVAVDDAVSTNEDTSVVISVLDNDSDPDGDQLTIVSNTDPSNGTLVLNENGTFTYTPNANYNGPDSFTYTITDANEGFDTATVSITVNPINDAPIAVDDSASVNEDTPVTISVLDNDSDVDGDDLTVVSTTSPSNGTVVINENGTITYTPNDNFNGSDSFEYTISDGNGGTDTATVTITVNAVNDAPVAVDDEATTDEDNAVTVSVLDNDSDVDGNGLTVTAVSTPSNGTVVINENGTITYTPNPDFNGTDSFEYTISDGNGGTDTATVTITVNPVDDAPPAPPTVSVTQPTCENPTGTITVQTIEGLTYSLNGVDYQESGVFADLEPGTYSVIAQDGFEQDSEITEVILIAPVAIAIETRTSVSQCYDNGSYNLFDLLVGDFDRTGTWENPNAEGSLDGSILDLRSFENDLGTYTFNYIIAGNCPSATEVQLTIDATCIVLVCSIDDIRDTISKAVTPNGDGFNDFFHVDLDLECGFTYNVQIFNRWGAEVYSMRNYQNNWDGFSNKSFTNSNQLPSGTYYYILEINGGAFEPIQGYIFLGTK